LEIKQLMSSFQFICMHGIAYTYTTKSNNIFLITIKVSYLRFLAVYGLVCLTEQVMCAIKYFCARGLYARGSCQLGTTYNMSAQVTHTGNTWKLSNSINVSINYSGAAMYFSTLLQFMPFWHVLYIFFS